MPHQKRSLIYMLVNKKNIQEKSFNVLMTLLINLQKLIAGEVLRIFKKNQEFEAQISEINEQSSTLLFDRCQFK